MRALVLVTGTGRSGTSTMAGALHHLGLHVPGPHLGANESNPKGFFESRWSVRFHRRLAEAAGINDVDSRPEAFDLVQEVVTDAHREEVRAFLERKGGGHDQVVVKDPRSVWTQSLWCAAASDVGRDTRFVTMLRHPAEVVGSRTDWYAGTDDEDQRRSYETFTVARWLNGTLVSERETRGQVRAFVHYPSLVQDWRPVIGALAEQLELHLDRAALAGEASPVDDFIDPGLHRHQVTWDDLTVPSGLRELADGVWGALGTLAEHAGRHEASSAELDVLAGRYRRMFREAVDLAHDALATERTDAARRAARKG